MPSENLTQNVVTTAISQSNYIPWKGYFDVIAAADVFVLYDDMQYTRRDWRNRNRIKTRQGPAWLTIPVEAKGKFLQKIRETRVTDGDWAETHWRTLVHSYSKAPFFRDYENTIEKAYQAAAQMDLLSDINRHFLELLSGLLGISAVFRWSSEFDLKDGKTEKLVGICEQLGAKRYLSGPAAKAYMDESLFEHAGISVEYMDYSGYPEYEQLYPPFDPAVSVLDLLFMKGPEARSFMKAGGARA